MITNNHHLTKRNNCKNSSKSMSSPNQTPCLKAGRTLYAGNCFGFNSRRTPYPIAALVLAIAKKSAKKKSASPIEPAWYGSSQLTIITKIVQEAIMAKKVPIKKE